MPRISRMCYESSFFHVMIQGINKEYIFSKNILKERFLCYLSESIKKYDVDLIAYCIMDNHVHLLIHTPEISKLSKLMHVLCTRYAKFYNRYSNRCGFVFRDRYRCENIMTQGHLDNCLRYIHNNPVIAKICDYPSQYSFSSYLDFNNHNVDQKIIKLLSWDVNNYTDRLNGCTGEYNFIDEDNEYWNEKNEILDKVILEYGNISKCNGEKLYKIICEIKKRCNVENKEIMKKMQISESTFYRLLRKFNSK